MDASLLATALRVADQAAGQTASAKTRPALAYVRAAAAFRRAEANFLDSIAADYPEELARDHVPGPRPLSSAQLQDVWEGVNEQAQRILGAFATHGGAMSPQDIMQVLGVEEPRLLNGPLGGISRRVKKLLGDSEATFYSVNPDDGRYVLPTATFEALCDVVENERPEWLQDPRRSGGPTATTSPGAEGGH
jgi:hypothetical protein